ncbi:hypothetical protein BABINDRAFT_7044 [Babjeviella inositovora NRRL Y-12698]|uniref:UBX domain-containing protein n=1 Tax=Babjeviella inositovora NRRL Y-12698 TaxID=984486 RepID=A0A1E3QUH3_9ASCO|nr:uncharacterized protein BABINDRAFT_7044 [Babjeviella inositovora NRRL Y-12698]ODQ81224.1 hypothetical protein BABINDRAFT_7044 [Babjeviella inositovora NRRL Y-12698]
MTELLPEQELKLAQYKDITSFEDADLARNIALLEECHWNLEVAIPRFFDGNFATATPPVEETQGALRQRRASGPQIMNLQEDMYMYDSGILPLASALPITNIWERNVGLIRLEEVKPPSPLVVILWFLPKTLLYVATRLLQILFPWLFNLSQGNTFPRVFVPPLILDNTSVKALLGEELDKSDNEKESLADFSEGDWAAYEHESVNCIEKESNNGLQYVETNFNGVYAKCKNRFEWLLVVVVDDSADCARLVASLDSKVFREYMEEHRVNLFLSHVYNPEGWEVGHVYKARQLPFITMLANVSNRPGTMHSMSIVAPARTFNHGRKMTAKKIITKVQPLMFQYEPQLIAERMDLMDAEFSRLLKQQQDSAYEASLKADKAKQEARKQKMKEEEEARKEEAQEENERANRAALRETFLQFNVLNFPHLLTDDSSLVRENSANIQFRLGDGSRIVKKFPKETTNYEIYLFVQLRLYLNAAKEGEEGEEAVVERIAEVFDVSSAETISAYDFAFDFELIQPFPKVRVEACKQAIEATKELYPSGNLLVELLDV